MNQKELKQMDRNKNAEVFIQLDSLVSNTKQKKQR